MPDQPEWGGRKLNAKSINVGPADADRDEKESFTWTVLDLVDWTREVHQGWRWAERELRQQANAK